MLTKNVSTQQKLELVYIDALVPEDHILKKIDKFIDFSFITELVKDLYCPDNGRPSIDPIVLFKMLFIGYLFGIRSERRLVKEIQVNMAYRWFLGLSLTDKVPDHSTISRNRIDRFKDTDIPQKIFDEIVVQAISHNFVSGKVLYTDSTHLKASANNKKFVKEQIQKSTKDYISELDQAVEEERLKHNKKPLKKKEHTPEIKETKISTTDPDSGYMYRDNKPEGFFYLDHRTVDIKYNIITDVHVTPGNINDVDPYKQIIERHIEKYEFDLKYVGLDAGYYTNPICKFLSDQNINGAIAYRSGPHAKGKFTKNKFTYDPEKDNYLCPNNIELTYKTTTRQGYSEYVCRKEICSECKMREKCLPEKSKFKTIYRHVWESFKEKCREFLKTEKGKGIYKKRKETVERSFADSKELHGLRYARYRGLEKVKEQCLLTAACMNMKKIATLLAR